MILKAFDDQGSIINHDTQLTEGGSRSFTLKRAPGAEAIDVRLYRENELLLRAEVAADPGEPTQVHIEWTGKGPQITSQGRRVLRLGLQPTPDEPSVIRPELWRGDIDVAVLLDATMLIDLGGQQVLSERLASLLALRHSGQPGHPVMQSIIRLVQQLSENANSVRTGVLGFADHSDPDITSRDLSPVFVTYPPEPELANDTPGNLSGLAERLFEIPPSPGADYIDALTDGLLHAREAKGWRQRSRKLLIVVGNSPGYSVLKQPPAGTNRMHRQHSLEEAVSDLHSSGIEITTVWLRPTEAMTELTEDNRMLLKYCRDQYRDLASVPQWYCEAKLSEPDSMLALVNSWRTPPAFLTRGAVPGILQPT